jgi:hypothetical protein
MNGMNEKPCLRYLRVRAPVSLLGTIPGCIEMHAVDPRPEPPDIHIAKVGEHEEGDIEYRCACELARMVGINLEG